MTDKTRNILTITMVLLLAVAAFLAGYLANEVFDVQAADRNESQVADDFALLDEAWNWVEQSYFGDKPSLQRVSYGAIRGALAELGDPYTIFVEPPAREEERERLTGNFGGVGVRLFRNDAGDLILEPIPGNPAEAAGIRIGDVLLAVDETPVTPELSVEEVSALIKGEKGTAVTLTVRHEGEASPVDVEIERGDILLPSVTYRLLDEDLSIGYIQLSRFSGESGGEVRRAIEDLQAQGAEKLILDLRHNPGGLLTAAVDVADNFLGDVVVLYQQSRLADEEAYRANSGAVAGDMPLIVLIDGGTASSAEILAGALQDHERALLVGTPTFGKGSVQLVYDLSDGSSVHVTSSRWLTPDRHEIDQAGLAPDLLVEVTQEALDAGRDEVLLRAISTLQGGNG